MTMDRKIQKSRKLLLYQKVPARERKERVERVLEKMNIITRRDHMPQQLSGGQQQRVQWSANPP
jgi:energy-coupling factor transporter ATP-binding protein EcfA2